MLLPYFVHAWTSTSRVVPLFGIIANIKIDQEIPDSIHHAMFVFHHDASVIIGISVAAYLLTLFALYITSHIPVNSDENKASSMTM